MTNEEENCKNLLISIILQAVEDYKSLNKISNRKDLKKKIYFDNYNKTLRLKLDNWFKSKYFKWLCGLSYIEEDLILKKIGVNNDK